MLILGTMFTIVLLVIGVAFIFVARNEAPDPRSSDTDARMQLSILKQAAERLATDIEPLIRSDKTSEATKVVEDHGNWLRDTKAHVETDRRYTENDRLVILRAIDTELDGLGNVIAQVPAGRATVKPTPPSRTGRSSVRPDRSPVRDNASGAVRVGGRIAPPQKTKDVRPVYPEIARAARAQGVVIMEVTVGVDGKVTDAKVLRSIPLLDAAALDAVKRWEFAPTLLKGVPVPIIMTVTVQFTLS